MARGGLVAPHGGLRGLAAAGLLAIAASSALAAPAAERSVWDGVFTADQVRNGSAVWDAECVKCHEVEEFTSPLFLLTWSGYNLHDLYEELRVTMPQDNPGKLQGRELVEIVAYMLSENGIPAGDDELGSDRDSLSGIRILRSPPPN